jgi:hypothetical protein
MNNPTLLAGLIAAAISLIGLAASLLTTRWQLRSKLSELEQTQLEDVLKERMKAYPKLWSTLQTNITNWNIEKKERDSKWATDFLAALNACSAEYGVFFSQNVYASFYELRTALIKIVDEFAQDPGSVSEQDLDSLVWIWLGKDKPGLSTRLKADLGSYRSTIFEQSS